MIRPKRLTVMIVVVAGIALCQAAIDTHQLTSVIKQKVADNLPSVDAKTLNDVAYDMAKDALANGNDYPTLEASLEKEFQKPEYDFLGWTKSSGDLQTAAGQIAAVADPL